MYHNTESTTLTTLNLTSLELGIAYPNILHLYWSVLLANCAVCYCHFLLRLFLKNKYYVVPIMSLGGPVYSSKQIFVAELMQF